MVAAKLIVSGGLADDEIRDFRDALGETGVETADLDIVRHRGVAETVAVVVVVAPLARFFASFGSEAGKDAYHRLARRLSGAARRQLEFEDSLSGATAKLPAKQFAALSRIDFARLPEGELVWDADAGTWRSSIYD